MRKKHLMQVRKAMAAFLAVAMIGQNSLVTTAESYVVEDQAIVARKKINMNRNCRMKFSRSSLQCRNSL